MEIKYTRRFTTDKDYEFEEITVTATLEDDVACANAIAELKKQVEESRDLEGNADVDDPPPKKKDKKKPKKEKDEDESDDTDEDESDDDADDEADEDDDEGNDDTETDEADDTDEEKSKSTKTKKAAASKKDKTGGAGSKKNFRKKPQVYQRENETHKELFSGLMKSVAPKWKASPESKAKAKSVSKKMEGKEFLDEDGKIFPSFKELVRKAMSKK